MCRFIWFYIYIYIYMYIYVYFKFPQLGYKSWTRLVSGPRQDGWSPTLLAWTRLVTGPVTQKRGCGLGLSPNPVETRLVTGLAYMDAASHRSRCMKSRKRLVTDPCQDAAGHRSCSNGRGRAPVQRYKIRDGVGHPSRSRRGSSPVLL